MSTYVPPRLDREGIESFTGLELLLSSLPQQAVVAIGGDSNAGLDKESVEAALRGARGPGCRAPARIAGCAQAFARMAVERFAVNGDAPTRGARRRQERLRPPGWAPGGPPWEVGCV